MAERTPAITNAGNCLLWDGPVTPSGYGYDRTARRPAHVAAYLESGRRIPKGWHVHHRCRNKLCVSQAHLVAMSPAAHAQEHAPPPLRTIRHLRLEAKVSIRDLAEVTGINKSILSRAERGLLLLEPDEVAALERHFGEPLTLRALLVAEDGS